METRNSRFSELVKQLNAAAPGLVECDSQSIDLRRCQDFLESLRGREADLKRKQPGHTYELLQAQAARRAITAMISELLRAEARCLDTQPGLEPATEEEVMAGLQELKETGGLELHQFIGELEQALHDRERART